MKHINTFLTVGLIFLITFSKGQSYLNGNGSRVTGTIETAYPLFTPYVDVCLWPPFDISKVDSTGICLYTLAFIVDDQFEEGANPCWGGYSTLDLTWYQDQITGLRENGGEIIVSFGGASGFPLAYVATDEFELKDAYKQVVYAYSLQSVDFDIEGMFVAHPESIERRSKAMKLLKDDYPELQISLTLPVMPWGLTGDGINVVTSAVNHDVDLSIVNIMAMDYGGAGDMGDNAIEAIDNVFSQLKSIYEDAGIPKPDSLIWKMIGVTPMIGQNDVMEEVFYLDDAVDVRDHAFEKNIGRIAIWSANRDRQCENSWDPLYICSHIEQEDFEFSNVFQMDGTISYCNITTAKDENSELSLSIDIYPNPANDYVILSGCKKANIAIADIEGRVLKEVKECGKNYKIDISGLNNGLYIVVIRIDNKISYKKLIITR